MPTEMAKKMELPIAVKSTTKMVKVPLDADAMLKIGQGLAGTMAQIEFLRDELKKNIAVQREHIGALKDQTRLQAKMLNHGWQESLESVEVHHDFNTEIVKTFYLGKCIEERGMTEDEKQMDLDFCLQTGMTLKVLPNLKNVPI